MSRPVPVGDLVPEVVSEILRRARSIRYDRWAEQVEHSGACAHPVRLTGAIERYDRATDRARTLFKTEHEPDGVLLIACGNRRASVCPSCSDTYRLDTYQLISAGLRGGKGVPESVVDHPRVFVTLTAPSFGAVHTQRADGTCHPHPRNRSCAHGRPLRCALRHDSGDTVLGRPLCADCYDYESAVLFNALAPDLWRRTTIYLRLHLARAVGLPVKVLRQQVRLSYAKVAEYQRRGIVHFHAVVRLDGTAADETVSPGAAYTAELLRTAVESAARAVSIRSPLEGPAVRWGDQIDVRLIETASRDQALTAEAVAGYVAKYATKATEVADAPIRRLTGRESLHEYDEHVARMIRVCWALAELPECRPLGLDRWAHTLGFRGHFSTKSRRYSTTLGALRQARTEYRSRNDQFDDIEDDTTVILRRWRFAGAGYRNRGDAVLAATAAVGSREQREAARLARLLDQPRPGQWG